MEETDLIVLWGSNARETHPIFFHHVLKAVHRGARLVVVDPRRTASARWADLWLGIDVGTDIPLACAVARELIAADLIDQGFIERATIGYDEFRRAVEPFTLAEGERLTGVPAERHPRARPRLRPRRPRRHLLDAGHHRTPQRRRQRAGPDQPGAAHRPCRQVRLGPEPAARTEQRPGRGDMGAIPNKLPGFQDIEKDAGARERFDAAWGVDDRSRTTAGI